MSTMLYTVTGRDTIFNGENDFEDMRKDPFCRYNGNLLRLWHHEPRRTDAGSA